MDYADPVRYELSSQIQTLLNSNSSILDSVDTKHYKLKSNTRNKIEAATSLAQSQRLHNNSSIQYHQQPQHQHHKQRHSASTPSLICRDDSHASSVKPYDYLVQADAEAATYIFQDRPLTNERQRRELQRPLSATTISRVAKHMAVEQKHHNSTIADAHQRQHLAGRHERDASVATTTRIRPNALFQHFEKTRRATHLRLRAKIKREEKKRSLNISLHLSSGVSMIRKQTLDERRENNRRNLKANIVQSVNMIKKNRANVRKKMNTSFALQKKDSLIQFETRRTSRRSAIKQNQEFRKSQLLHKSLSRDVLHKTSQPGHEIHESTNAKGTTKLIYVPRTGKRSNTGSRVLTNTLPELNKSIICVDGSTLFDDVEEGGEEEEEEEEQRNSGYFRNPPQHSMQMNWNNQSGSGGSIIDGMHDLRRMKEMRLVQDDGTSAILDSTVWKREDIGREEKRKERGEEISYNSKNAYSVLDVTGGGGGSREGDVAWEDYDGIEYLMATSTDHGTDKNGNKQKQKQTGSSRPSNSRGFLQHRRGPIATPPFGTGSGRSFTPQYDAVIGGLPPPWGVVSPHHATG